MASNSPDVVKSKIKIYEEISGGQNANANVNLNQLINHDQKNEIRKSSSNANVDPNKNHSKLGLRSSLSFRRHKPGTTTGNGSGLPEINPKIGSEDQHQKTKLHASLSSIVKSEDQGLQSLQNFQNNNDYENYEILENKAQTPKKLPQKEKGNRERRDSTQHRENLNLIHSGKNIYTTSAAINSGTLTKRSYGEKIMDHSNNNHSSSSHHNQSRSQMDISSMNSNNHNLTNVQLQNQNQKTRNHLHRKPAILANKPNNSQILNTPQSIFDRIEKDGFESFLAQITKQKSEQATKSEVSENNITVIEHQGKKNKGEEIDAQSLDIPDPLEEDDDPITPIPIYTTKPKEIRDHIQNHVNVNDRSLIQSLSNSKNNTIGPHNKQLSRTNGLLSGQKKIIRSRSIKEEKREPSAEKKNIRKNTTDGANHHQNINRLPVNKAKLTKKCSNCATGTTNIGSSTTARKLSRTSQPPTKKMVSKSLSDNSHTNSTKSSTEKFDSSNRLTPSPCAPNDELHHSLPSQSSSSGRHLIHQNHTNNYNSDDSDNMMKLLEKKIKDLERGIDDYRKFIDREFEKMNAYIKANPWLDM